jgi:hypothetical protein
MCLRVLVRPTNVCAARLEGSEVLEHVGRDDLPVWMYGGIGDVEEVG